MADDKKKKEKKKGSGAGKIFLLGLIIGIIGGVMIGWMTEPPAAFKGTVDQAKRDAADSAKGAADKVRGGAADALEKGADTVRPEDK